MFKFTRISNLKAAVETSLREIRQLVSTSLQTNFHAFSMAFRNPVNPLSESSSLLIQISSLRRNNNLLTSVINNALTLGSRCSRNQIVSYLWPFSMAMLRTEKRSFHQTRKAFCTIFPRRQKNLASRENYASALHQATILRHSKVGRTSFEWMVNYGRVHFIAFQNITFLCMRNWGKINSFRTTWTQFCRLFP